MLNEINIGDRFHLTDDYVPFKAGDRVTVTDITVHYKEHPTLAIRFKLEADRGPVKTVRAVPFLSYLLCRPYIFKRVILETNGPKKKKAQFVCLECGREFFSTRSANRATRVGCPGCGGVDIDLS